MLQTLSALPEGSETANLSAAIRVSSDGKFLYASNRGHDSIAIYHIDSATGLLSLVGYQPSGGRTPSLLASIFFHQRNSLGAEPGHFVEVARSDEFLLDHPRTANCGDIGQLQVLLEV